MSIITVIGKHKKTTAGHNTTVIGNDAISIHNNCFVLGDNCSTTGDNQCVIGDTLFGKPLNDHLKEFIIKNPRLFEEFILMLVYQIHGNNNE